MQRFMEKVRSTPSGCMEWTGGTNGAGYGLFFTDWAGGRDLRCTRCKTWWIAVEYGAADMTFWGWVIIDSPPVTTKGAFEPR